jgi:hypothetical protein
VSISNLTPRSTFLPALAIAVAVSICWVGGASHAVAGAGSPDPNYVVYGGCGIEGTTPPSHLCRKGDQLGAFFQSLNGDSVYTVCVRFPLGEKTLCREQQQALAGVLYVNKVTSGIVGKTTITWSVSSVQIGEWSFGLYPDPVVAKFGINPLIVSKSHRLAGLLIKHAGEDVRVRAWRRCGGFCPLKLRWVGKHQAARRYLIPRPSGGAPFALGDTLYIQVDAPGGTDGHGSRLWGRLYTGRFVRDPKGAPGDTAIRHIGSLLCTPPDGGPEDAVDCDQVQ